jgi:hypothetical protein
VMLHRLANMESLPSSAQSLYNFPHQGLQLSGLNVKNEGCFSFFFSILSFCKTCSVQQGKVRVLTNCIVRVLTL